MSPVLRTPTSSTQTINQDTHEEFLPTRGGSWAPEPSPGAYSRIPAWNGGTAWFDAVLDLLATGDGEKARRKARIARDTLLRVARADWLSADSATGRGVTTAHNTVAKQLGMSSKTVQRARQLLETLGFATTVIEGRYLTAEERQQAHTSHGGNQNRIASTRALTMPKPQDVENVHLPRRGYVLKTSFVKKNLTKRANAREKAQIKRKKSPTFRTSAYAPLPRPIEIQRFTAILAASIPGLTDRCHIGALSDVLTRAQIDPTRWTPQELIRTINLHNTRHNITFPNLKETRNPLAYFAWILRQTTNPNQPTPTEQRRIDNQQRLHEQEQRRKEYDAEEQRLKTIDHDEIARIKQASDNEIAQLNRAKRYT